MKLVGICFGKAFVILDEGEDIKEVINNLNKLTNNIKCVEAVENEADGLSKMSSFIKER